MRADRLISMLMLLQTRGQMTAGELAERLEVSTRTVYRDLDALSVAGVPVYAERGPHGGCALMESYRTNLTGLKEDEVRALFSFTVPGLLGDLGIGKASESALLKLTAALPRPFQDTADFVRRRVHFDPVAWQQGEEPTPHLTAVQEALWQGQRLDMTYRRGDGAWRERVVEPLGLVAKAGVWYLVAGMKMAGRPDREQIYRVSRIEAARVTDEPFVYPADFELAAYWTAQSAQFQESLAQFPVTLRVAHDGVPALVQTFGEGIHHSIAQAEINATDGSSLLSLVFSSEEEACRQILRLGTVVEIVEPLFLKAQVVAAARELIEHYGKREQERF